MSEKVKLQLGDVILLHAPTNSNFNDNTYFIQYLDHNKIVLLSEEDSSTETLFINEETGQLREESITEIDLLDRDDVKGYARQNDLLPDKWIDVYFGGDVPITITGRISNLEEDMIEITTYPDQAQIYIDFGYIGIPDDLPIDKIIIREAPENKKTMKMI